MIVFLALLLSASCDRGSRPDQIGRTAPDFTVRDSERSVHLADLRGKPVVLNFWASWCPPCLEETPSLLAMQRQMRGRVVVLAVNVRDSDSGYHDFLQENHVDLLTVRDDREMSNTLYGTFRFPESYVIDSNGVMRRKFIGPVNWLSPEVMDYLDKLAADSRPTQQAAK